jgi:hypothetical protein
MSKTEEKLIGYAAVDSGQMMVCDPYYIDNQWEGDNMDFDQEPNENGLYPFNYGGCATATLSEKQAGAMHFKKGFEGAGVVFSTGFGDGLYPVYATFSDEGEWGTRVKSIRVEFIED